MHLVQSLDCWSGRKSDESAVFSVEDSSQLKIMVEIRNQ